MKKSITISVFAIIILVSLINLSSALIIDSVSMIPNEVAPGEVAIIHIELENNGVEDIQDVSVSLNLENVPFAPYNSATDYNVDEIEENDEETAKFKIIALNNAQSGIYKIPVEISYIENDVQKLKKSLIGISVNSKPIIGANIEDNLFIKGEEVEILVEITNKGISDARFVEIYIGSSSLFSIRGSTNSYIGDISSDDFDSVKFNIRFDKEADNKVNIPISVIYKDGINNQYSNNFNILIDVYSKEEAIELGLLKKNNFALYLGIVVALIIIYIIYKRVKKVRRERNNKEME